MGLTIGSSALNSKVDELILLLVQAKEVNLLPLRLWPPLGSARVTDLCSQVSVANRHCLKVKATVFCVNGWRQVGGDRHGFRFAN